MIFAQIFGTIFLSAIGLFIVLILLMLCGIDIPNSFWDGQKYTQKQAEKSRYYWEKADDLKNEYAVKNLVSQYFFALGFRYEKSKQDHEEANADAKAERLQKLLDKHK